MDFIDLREGNLGINGKSIIMLIISIRVMWVFCLIKIIVEFSFLEMLL